MTARRGQRPAFAHARPVQDCRNCIEAGRRFAGLRDPSSTIPGGLRAGSRPGGAAFAQACKAASPCPWATADTGSPIGFFVAEHAPVSIVEIDLTRIGAGPRAFAIPSDPARWAPPSVAAARTAQTTAAEKADRNRTPSLLCMGPFPCAARSHCSSASRLANPNSAHGSGPRAFGQPRSRRNKRRKLLRANAGGSQAPDGLRQRNRQRSVGVFGEETVAQARGPQYDTRRLRIASARR
jgi:hypothetical protein